jgi:ketosteroid isomerase-like protein
MNDIKQELEKVGSAYMESFNRQDAAGIAALYANGGMHINPAGPRTDIEQLYQAIFKAGFDHQEANLDEAWPLGTDAALAIGQYRIGGKDLTGAPMERGGYWTATYVREDGKWKIRLQTALPK